MAVAMLFANEIAEYAAFHVAATSSDVGVMLWGLLLKSTP